MQAGLCWVHFWWNFLWYTSERNNFLWKTGNKDFFHSFDVHLRLPLSAVRTKQANNPQQYWKSFNANLNVNHFKRLQIWRNAMLESYLCSKAKNLYSCSDSIFGIIQMNLFCLALMRICLLYFNLFLHFHILRNYKF